MPAREAWAVSRALALAALLALGCAQEVCRPTPARVVAVYKLQRSWVDCVSMQSTTIESCGGLRAETCARVGEPGDRFTAYVCGGRLWWELPWSTSPLVPDPVPGEPLPCPPAGPER